MSSRTPNLNCLRAEKFPKPDSFVTRSRNRHDFHRLLLAFGHAYTAAHFLITAHESRILPLAVFDILPGEQAIFSRRYGFDQELSGAVCVCDAIEIRSKHAPFRIRKKNDGYSCGRFLSRIEHTPA